jgi:Concanavalin A-like lectin/glucanases superfamily
MHQDLLDLLSGWQGNDLNDGRRAELLTRLRGDEAFRHAFVEEIRLLGMLKAVQSTEPRWLRLEDELGWSADEQAAAIPLEDRVLRHIQDQPRPRKFGRWKWGALTAAVLLIGLASLYLMWGDHKSSAPSREVPRYVAVLVKDDGAQWESGDGSQPAEGSTLTGGRHRLREGRVTLTLFNGVILSVQGPADLDLESVERIYCQHGKLRARVPPGAEGFTVLAPGASVVDLGTEFGLNVAADGTAELMVFEGQAEVSVLNAQGYTLRSQLLEGKQAVRVDPGTGHIREVPAAPDNFVVAPELIPPALVLDPTYPDVVQQSNPWGYWRFEALTDGLIRNEVADGPPLRAVGPVKLAGAPGGNRSVQFERTPEEQYLKMDGSWTPPRQTGYAVELWALPEEFNGSILVSLFSRVNPDAQNHLFLLELVGRRHHLVHEPFTVRYLDRWPPGTEGGVNAFSRRMYVPCRWLHLVAQKVGNRQELYMDGSLVGTAEAESEAATEACRLVVGRLRTGKHWRLDQIRQFVGRLDELAVYDHPLSHEDIRRHYELGSTGKVGAP